MYLRQSTASQEILLGRFVDSTDGNTEETGLTIANTDIKIWKSGATTLADKNSGGATHIANGMYYAVLDATDTDTVGNLEVHVHVSGALSVKREFSVVEEAVYDAFFAASAAMPVTLAASAVSAINAEVVDALATDTYAEPGQGAPAATTTLAAKINYLYKAWRNKSETTSTSYKLYADDASTVDQKTTNSDNGTTFTRGEVATGP